MQTPKPDLPLVDEEAIVRLDDMRALRQDFTRFMLPHRFAMEEIVTKLTILHDEFALMHDNNPIEHIASRLKSPDSIAEKMVRKGSEPTFASIRETITDIAGVRVTCSFVSDVYKVLELLSAQSDITVLEVRDYVAVPKAHGYRSLHALVSVPVHLSEGPLPVTVEVQLRTIAMDFWASLEHKIHYKYRGAVPSDLAERLRDAAAAAHSLDTLMEELHEEVKSLGADGVARLPEDIRHRLSVDDVEPSERLIAQLRRLADGDGKL